MYEPIKSLGQNFLLKSSIVTSMVDALDIENSEDIIEIGPGHGVLTEALFHRITDRDIKVYSVEVDERFAKKLLGMFSLEPTIEIIHDDILKWLPTFTSERRVKVFGSLPYYITSPILHSVIKMNVMPEKVVFLIQKEVAEKVCSKVPDASYLSTFVQTFYNAERLFDVSKNEFTPAPKVDGSVIKLTRKDIKMDLSTIERYEGFLHKAFSHPRKMLNKPFTKEELSKGGIDPKLRAQNLSPEEWLAFYKILHS
ncbi:MAG: Ribosomal RNA small subunit methyltransferase A [uncultured bacterium]|uniref:Ribosomal RNA small subunit methyltransferase A n=3 Tax=Katanobacteria TaxID=422282 RepID=A0A1F4W3W6_UNCKA|nr:MAG: Ribosomal RNA small subunit methyltransferase A [uncultured bacterium]KKS02415.1 MAG: Ribosomal RNA small subunit methyltransferase A [candidate division WWE3 bacterium GW2011_GWC2_41_23]KKS10355.1 MAG: Ribosomal RNA small subunit methyltransferase A [candidate division WWE3 bacterium GW2011_GWF2_41_45]KKS26984.1 MAG: Ribosomal RNA small subunit methyltransferase A [candidate division WWE3 bacterium GW2011_GWC1_42_102]KKS28305.1 MAG: Ribosomal RNA small subunit methyltransferase A [cand